MSLSYTTHRVNMKFHISSKTPDFNPLKYLKLATSWWSGNLEKKEKEKEEKGEKKRIQLALHLEIYIQPFRNILTPFRKLVMSKCYYLPRIDLLDE